MINEMRDPREAVLDGIVDDAAKALLHATLTEPESLSTEMPYSLAAALRKLDAADPRLAMWGELVEALEDEGPNPRHHRQTMARHRVEWPMLWEALDRLLTLTRALDATNQGGDK